MTYQCEESLLFLLQSEERIKLFLYFNSTISTAWLCYRYDNVVN